MNARLWLVCGALLGALGVSMGAIGAHGFKKHLGADLRSEDAAVRAEAEQRIAWFETGVRYHLVHAPAIVLVALLGVRGTNRALNVAGGCFVAGVVLFSGLLVAVALTRVMFMMSLVPVGGIALIVGWCALARAGWTLLRDESTT